MINASAQKEQVREAMASLLKYCKVQVPVRHTHEVTIYHIIAHSYRKGERVYQSGIRKRDKLPPKKSIPNY